FGSRLKQVQCRAERLAFDQQKLAFHVMALQLCGCAHRYNAPAIEEYQTVAVFGFVHIVRRDEYRDPFSDHVVNHIPELPARNGIYSGRGLIEENDWWTMQYGAP